MKSIRDILKDVREKRLSIDEAEKLISLHSIESIEDMVRLDIDRENRKGVPEVIYGENKSLEDLKKIASKVLERNERVLISRVNDINGLAEHLKDFNLKIGRYSNTILAYKDELREEYGPIGIMTAGTSDIKIAEEAEFMLASMDCKIIKGYDVGIAGIHRLFPVLKEIIEKDADAIIVIAGMEGALVSIVSSLVDIPVIGVPTSVGYGFGAGGHAALASMLQSCTFGVAVMNIDNGIGAGALAALIAKRIAKFKKS